MMFVRMNYATDILELYFLLIRHCLGQLLKSYGNPVNVTNNQ